MLPRSFAGLGCAVPLGLYSGVIMRASHQVMSFISKKGSERPPSWIMLKTFLVTRRCPLKKTTRAQAYAMCSFGGMCSKESRLTIKQYRGPQRFQGSAGASRSQGRSLSSAGRRLQANLSTACCRSTRVNVHKLDLRRLLLCCSEGCGNPGIDHLAM